MKYSVKEIIVGVFLILMAYFLIGLGYCFDRCLKFLVKR